MASIQEPTENFISNKQHGQFKAVDYSARKHPWTPAIGVKGKTPNIYAVEDGKISSYKPSGDCGNRLELTSADGKRRWGHCHLEKAYIKSGKVIRGQLIGKMGYTGLTVPKGEGGRHLHLVCLTGGKYVYPPTLVNADFRSYQLGYPKTVVTTDNLYIREKPTTKAKIIGKYKKGTKVKVVALVKGQKVGGNDKWYKVSSAKYIWSGGTKG